MSRRAAIRYAKAVLQQASESNTQEVVFGDMQSVYHTIQNSRDLQLALQSPVIMEEDKRKVLLDIFKDQGELMHSMINVLVNNKRASILAEVSKSYIELYQEQQGVKDVTVITAISLTDAMEKKVMAKVKELTGSDSVNLKNIIDPKILGGFVLRIGDVQYNASIANQLGNLKREFSKA